MRKNPFQIFRCDPNTVISNNNSNGPLVYGEDGDRDRLIRALHFIEGILRVANEIDQYLQHLVTIDSHERNW